MRAVVQRVTQAEVRVEGDVVGVVGTGFLVLLGAAQGDTPEDAAAMATKIASLRLFSDADGRMNLSLADVGGEVLLVSQFTLLADVRKGRRPSFVAAADPKEAVALIAAVGDGIRDAGVPVSTGRFGASMQVDLVNDGPVTVVIEAAEGAIL